MFWRFFPDLGCRYFVSLAVGFQALFDNHHNCGGLKCVFLAVSAYQVAGLRAQGS